MLSSLCRVCSSPTLLSLAAASSKSCLILKPAAFSTLNLHSIHDVNGGFLKSFMLIILDTRSAYVLPIFCGTCAAKPAVAEVRAIPASHPCSLSSRSKSISPSSMLLTISPVWAVTDPVG